MASMTALESTSCLTIAHTTGQVYKTFDVDGHGKVDWRCMLFMLRVAVNAQVYVAHGFEKWTSLAFVQ